jgi:hypothetical protein
VKTFEQKYGYLLRLYPASYREERGAEMLAVLAENGRRPSLRERGALIVGGLRARLRADDDRTIAAGWSAAFYLAATALLLTSVAEELLRSMIVHDAWVWAQAVASVVAFGLAWRRQILPAALATIAAVVFDAVGRQGFGHLTLWEQPIAALLLLGLIGRTRPAVPRWPVFLFPLLPAIALLQLPLFRTSVAWLPPMLVLALAVPVTLIDHRVGLAAALISVLGVLDTGWDMQAFFWRFPEMASVLWPVVLTPVAIVALGSLLARRRARL